MLRILIADDHPAVRCCVREVLEKEKGWHVCGEASTGREAVAMTGIKKPDVVLLDFSMPELNGFEAAREIHEKFPQTEMLILTMHDAHEFINEARASGVRGCILKSDLQHLVAAVRGLSDQGRHSSNPASNAVVEEDLKRGRNNEPPKGPAATLTHLEQQILQMFAQAKGNGEIATALSLSEKTIETHRVAIMRKLDVNSTFDLVRYAVRKHLVEVKSAGAMKATNENADCPH